MALHVHTLDEHKHKTFLAEGRVDPVTKERLSIGDRIILCSKCKRAFLETTWLAQGNSHCNQYDTLKSFPPTLEIDFKPIPPPIIPKVVSIKVFSTVVTILLFVVLILFIKLRNIPNPNNNSLKNGTIEMTIEPLPATVYINNEPINVDHAPFTISKPAEMYKIKIMKECYNAEEETITINNGNYNIKRTLKPVILSLKHTERFVQLCQNLKKGGMSEERIKLIFSSSRTNEIDLTPVNIMSKRVLVDRTQRSSTEINSIVNLMKINLSDYKTYYDDVESKYAVNREIIAAILFEETSLGKFTAWKHDSFTVLNSMLSFFEISENSNDSDRKRMNRLIKSTGDNLAALLLYCERNNIDILHTSLPSSYTGAIGLAQFLPENLSYAVSANNKKPELSRMSDAILSIGNLLKNKLNWPGLVDFSKLENIDDITTQWYEYNKQKDVSLAVGANLDGYTLRRFDEEFKHIPNIEYIGNYARVLMGYNFSSSYVIDVLQLAFHANLTS
ncbi:MAG: lytic murein transglycosylase [Nitrospirae bacterium]|nr:lytic murein transglycosylase [Nitrospirota bacterium]